MPNHLLHTNSYDSVKRKTLVSSLVSSQRTLRDGRNYIRPSICFNHQIINELTTKTRDSCTPEKYVVLSFDEMKIQDDLVYDKNTGNLIGYVDLGDIDVNLATLQNMDKNASHVLVFLIKNVMNPLSYSLATFSTMESHHIRCFLYFGGQLLFSN